MMNKHAHLLKMFSGCQYTKEIAALYFPQFKCVVTQLKAFEKTIAETPEMHAQMTAKGYKRGSEFLTPQVIAVIAKHWGMPDEVEMRLTAMAQEKEKKATTDKEF